MPANLAWLRRARCGGQASTTGSLEKPQAPQRPVFRFQAFKAGPFLESYQPYHCRVTRASSDNQMAHLFFFFNPLPGSLQEGCISLKGREFLPGQWWFLHITQPSKKCPLIKFGGTEAKRKNLKKQQIFTGLANEIQVRFFFFSNAKWC